MPLWGSDKKEDGPPQEFVCFPEENIWTNAERFDIMEPYSYVKGAVCHDWNVRSDLYSGRYGKNRISAAPDAAERHGRAAARVAGERSVRQRCRALLFGLSRPLCRGGPRVPARRGGGHDHDGQRSRGPAACIPFHRRGRGAHHHRRHRPGRLSAAARPAGRRALPARLRRLPRGADAGARRAFLLCPLPAGQRLPHERGAGDVFRRFPGRAAGDRGPAAAQPPAGPRPHGRGDL